MTASPGTPEQCNYPMPRAGEPCAKRAGHVGAHWTVSVLERRREYDRKHTRERRADPAYRERQREYKRNPAYLERQREYDRKRYWSMSGFEYNKELLRLRRKCALQRMTARKARQEEAS